MRRWIGWTATTAVLLLGAGALAQPHKEGKEAHHAHKDAHEEAKEANKDAKEEANEAKEEAKEAKDAIKHAKEETKEAIEARRKRAHELHEKLKKGLSDKEKAELHEIRERFHEHHHEAIEHWKERHEKLVDRRREARREILGHWGPIIKRPAVHAELERHARRMARLEVAKHRAEVSEKDDLRTKINKLIETERARHDKRMDALKAKGD